LHCSAIAEVMRARSKSGAIRPRAKLRGSRPDYHLPPWYPNDSDHFQKRSGCACFNGLSCHSRGSAAKSAVNSLPSHSRARFERRFERDEGSDECGEQRGEGRPVG
jgi:hypothetical protein